MVVDGVFSDWSAVTKGVPQGSILSPLMFIIFVNDMPDVVKYCTVNQYADDITVEKKHMLWISFGGNSVRGDIIHSDTGPVLDL